jgi:hypothetical protein
MEADMMAGAAPPQARRRQWFAAVLAVTLLPLLGLPLLAALGRPFHSTFLLGLGVFVGGVCHVASTMYFYADADARPIMQRYRARFYALPLAAVALSALALTVSRHLAIADDVVLAIFFAHLVWLYFHYQRQNYGLLAFAAAASGRRTPEGTLKLLMLPPLAGGLASFPQLLSAGLERELPITGWLPTLQLLAWAVYAVAALGMARLALRHREVFAQPLVRVFALTALCFYLPALLIRDIDYAFWSYAIAHGLQYLLMVGIVSAQARIRWLALPAFLLAAVAGGWALDRFGGTHALFICGILLTWVHFALDARLWRMSEPTARAFLRRRFAFIFD